MRIFDSDSWNEIWDTISRNRKRSIATAFGVFWGIFMLIMLLGLGLGLERQLRNQFGSMAVNSAHFMSGRTSIPYMGLPQGRWWRFDNSDVEALRNMPGIDAVEGFPWPRWGTRFTAGERHKEFNLAGFSPQYNVIAPQRITRGRFINDMDETLERKVAVIGTVVADEFFPDEDPIGKTVRMGNTSFTVVGVNSPPRGQEREMVIIPLSTFQKILNLNNTIDRIMVKADDNVNVIAIQKNIEQFLKRRHMISPDDGKAMYTYNAREEFEMFSNLFNGLGLLTWIVGIGTLLAGIVGISNIMLVVVRERTQEIGVRRALGAPPGAIISQIISESFVLTFISGMLGLCLGVGLLSGISSLLAQNAENAENAFNGVVTFGMAMIALGVIMLGGVLAGIIPAMRAMVIKPVDAIREE